MPDKPKDEMPMQHDAGEHKKDHMVSEDEMKRRHEEMMRGDEEAKRKMPKHDK